VNVVQVAQRIADEVLFPAALATEASAVVPRELLDALAGAGLYGLAAPGELGGLDADFGTVCAVLEALASGCLTTAFVWMQHNGLVQALMAGDRPELARTWLPPLASGEIRAGLALGGALPRPTLRAEPDGQGWRLDGVSPFVSGWGRIDVVHAAARADDGEIVWLLVDAAEGPSVRAERLRLAALDATATVRLTFDRLPVPALRVTSKHPAPGETPSQVLRTHAALALGVAARCCQMLALEGPGAAWTEERRATKERRATREGGVIRGPSSARDNSLTSLDGELAALRAELDRLGPGILAARAAAGELALRAASALMTTAGSRSLLVTEHGQRLAREAMFALVYALRPGSRDALLARLGAAGPG
jgi:alkylation response protein AidB-like acyl-CoA dehydrogenase